MQKKTTIYVNARFVTQPLTGVQRYAFECCMQMKKSNPDMVFLCPKKSKQQEWSKELMVLPIGHFSGHYWEQIELVWYLRNKKHYVLFNPCNTAPLLLSKNFITVHDISYNIYRENNPYLFSAWYNFLMPRIINKAVHVFTVSETVRQQLILLSKKAPDKISVTYNGVAIQFSEAAHEPIKKEKLILAVGSISRRKNIEILIEAFLESGLQHEYTLIFVGGQHTAFSKLHLTQHNNIIFKSNPSDNALSDYYQRAECVVSLSFYEGFGLPVLEALASNCKVLCSDIRTYHELFEEYVYFCNHYDKADIIRKLVEMTYHEQSNRINQNFLKEKYSFSKSAKQILCHLESYTEI
jgi:glycosyltransferase involved in cell wall biosynthesis